MNKEIYKNLRGISDEPKEPRTLEIDTKNIDILEIEWDNGEIRAEPPTC